VRESANVIEIDGSFGEGGGQILRTALALSCITGKPFRLFNVRAKRDKPGLRPQHTRCVTAAAAISDAKTRGATVGSSEIEFAPGALRPGDYRFDIGTAGSTCLVLQTVFYPLAFAGGESSVTIIGGTHNPFAPCYHYLEQQWGVFMRRLGFELELHMGRAGFFPLGGGEIRARIRPVGPATVPRLPAPGLNPLTLEDRGALRGIRGLSAVANLDRGIAERQKKQASRRLAGKDLRHEIELRDLASIGKGTILLLAAEFEHSQACYFGLGEIRKRAERVADEACDGLFHLLKGDGVVDEYLADQLVVPLALAAGESRFTTPIVTQHLLTNVAVVRRFVPVDVTIEGAEGEQGRVVIRPQNSLEHPKSGV